MGEFKKYGSVEKKAGSSPDMDLINAQALTELSEEDVFTFLVVACDDQVDRDYEYFPLKSLENLADLFVGRPIIFDHSWSAHHQTARIYDADVQEKGGVNRLMVSAYMLRSEDTAPTIAAIEGGILREVSISCQVKHCICSICGTDKAAGWCEHRPGNVYDGKLCSVALADADDAYEMSFVAVPAQREAGVTKAYGGENRREETQKEIELQRVKAILELEKNRFA